MFPKQWVSELNCDDVVLDVKSNGTQVYYGNGPGIDNKLWYEEGSTYPVFFLTDHLGSTRALVSHTGSIIPGTLIDYDSFGVPSTTLPTRFQYAGRAYDPDTELYYYRARWYDPVARRFISEDPIGLEGGINLYAYVGNNSLNFLDPLGLEDIALSIVGTQILDNPPSHQYGGELAITYQLTIDGEPAEGWTFQEQIIPHKVIIYPRVGPPFLKDLDMKNTLGFGNIGPMTENRGQIETDCDGHFTDAPYGIISIYRFSGGWDQKLRAVKFYPNGDIMDEIDLGTNIFKQHSNYPGHSVSEIRNRKMNIHHKSGN